MLMIAGKVQWCRQKRGGRVDFDLLGQAYCCGDFMVTIPRYNVPCSRHSHSLIRRSNELGALRLVLHLPSAIQFRLSPISTCLPAVLLAKPTCNMQSRVSRLIQLVHINANVDHIFKCFFAPLNTHPMKQASAVSVDCRA